MSFTTKRHPTWRWFWLSRPNVPGGANRVYITDDFGNFSEVKPSTWAGILRP